MVEQERLDIWFTQDAVDADNLPTARLTAIYAIQMLQWYDTVHIWCDVSTATRSLGCPRLRTDVIVDGNLYVEDHSLISNEISHESILEDTKLCEAYDTCLLMVIFEDTISTHNNIHMHYVLGGNPKQKLQDSLIPNNFLFFDLKLRMVNTIDKVVNLQDTLEGIVNQKYIYKETSREPWGKGEKITVIYDPSNDSNFDTRRYRFHEYIKDQVKSFGVLDGNKLKGDLFYDAEGAISCIDNISSDINILAFAPLTNTAKLTAKLQMKSRVKKVIGHLLTLNSVDNYVGVQWNEYLNMPAAASFYTEIQSWQHDCLFFFTPTQCFKASKNQQFKEQKCLNEVKEVLNACCMLSTDRNNIYTGYQKLWNLFKCGQLKSSPEWWMTKGEIIFDPLALLYLLESLVNPDENNSVINKFSTCCVKFTRNEFYPEVTLNSGRFKVPDVRNDDCINPSILKSYLRIYNVHLDHEVATDLVKSVYLFQQEKNLDKKIKLKKHIQKLQSSLWSDLVGSFGMMMKFVFVVLVVFLMLLIFYIICTFL